MANRAYNTQTTAKNGVSYHLFKMMHDIYEKCITDMNNLRLLDRNKFDY